MQAQHPLLPAVRRWMSAIQAKGFKLRTRNVGNTTVSILKFGLITLLAYKACGEGRRESSSLGEFYPIVTVKLCLCPAALASLPGQFLALWIKRGPGQNLFPF